MACTTRVPALQSTSACLEGTCGWMVCCGTEYNNVTNLRVAAFCSRGMCVCTAHHLLPNLAMRTSTAWHAAFRHCIWHCSAVHHILVLQLAGWHWMVLIDCCGQHSGEHHCILLSVLMQILLATWTQIGQMPGFAQHQFLSKSAGLVRQLVIGHHNDAHGR